MRWVVYVMFAALASALVAIIAVGTGMVTDKQSLEGWSLAVIIATIFVGSLRAFAMALPENPKDPDNTP